MKEIVIVTREFAANTRNLSRIFPILADVECEHESEFVAKSKGMA
jgi:hypothetical protein